MNNTQNETTPAPVAGSESKILICPECRRPAIEDHNSFRCDWCLRLWPKGFGYELYGPAPAAGSEPVACGDYWCLRPGKAPTLCMIREVCDETPDGDPLPKVAIRFLASGADFYFERWRELYANDARFVPALPPSHNQSGGGQ
jgi:hypothetical protein